MATAAATASRPRTDSGSTSDSEYVEDATTEMLGQFRADVDFFEAMLDLIPAKFYIRDEEAEAQHWKNSRYYRVRGLWAAGGVLPFAAHSVCVASRQNKKGDAPKQALKENTKKAKKAKFDLSTPHTTTQKKREQAQQDAASRDVTGEQAAARGRTNSSASAGSSAAAPAPTTGGSIQDLRARLRARIEDLRKKRKADDKDGPGEAAAVQPGEKKKRRRAKRDAEKAKRANGAAAPAPRGGAFANKGTDAKLGAAGAGAGAGAGAAAAAVPVAIDYGVVKFSTSAADQPLKKKKTNTLQQLLAKVRCCTLTRVREWAAHSPCVCIVFRRRQSRPAFRSCLSLSGMLCPRRTSGRPWRSAWLEKR